MKDGKLAYMTGLMVGAIMVIAAYAAGIGSTIYLLFFSDQKFMAFLPLTFMFVFSIWRRMQMLFVYNDMIRSNLNAKVDSDQLNSEIAKLLYRSSVFGGPN